MAASQKTVSDFAVTIGIESHVQLKTATKLFSAAGNDAREAPANTLINHIDLGMPGALPVLNEAAVETAIRAALALGTRPQKFSKFDRKHYFYPDLPNGYQITQFYNPIIKNGSVSFSMDGEERQARIREAHLEADAGKTTHPSGREYSLVDFNRAGTPLLEIVSEPDLRSPAEAKAYARELYLIVRYAGVSDASLYYGNMRFDVNVSISDDPNRLGTRVEIKNINSFRNVERASEYEIKRQIELKRKGKQIIQETRGWDESKQRTISQRGKEEAHDYRYMPDPDIPPILLTDKMISKVSASMPLLPSDYRESFSAMELDNTTGESLIDNMESARLVKDVQEAAGAEDAKRVANWLVNVSPDKMLVSASEDPVKTTAGAAIRLSRMVADNKLSSTAAKEVWIHMAARGGEPEEIAADRNLLQLSDEHEIAEIVKQVLAENEKAANDVRQGEKKAIGFLVGQVMKRSKGKANPALAQDLIKRNLGS